MKKLNYIILILFVCLFTECEKLTNYKTNSIDCSITHPENNEEYKQGDTIFVNVEIQYKEEKIEEVQLYVDSEYLLSDEEFPFNFDLSTREIVVGEHLISVLVISELGKKGSDNISIIINENNPPVASFKITYINDIYLFDASESHDVEDDSTKLMVRWDWDNDGDWDTDFSYNKYEEICFEKNTPDSVFMQVMDKGGKTAFHKEEILYGLFTDIDNVTYRSVKIGKQHWMAENLKSKHFRNGDTIPEAWPYNNDDTYYEKRGLLYSWFAVNDKRNIAPEGWHVPSTEEWAELVKYLSDNGYSGEEAVPLKSISGWMHDRNGTDEFGMTISPTGYRNQYGIYYGEDADAFFWTSTEKVSELSWYYSFWVTYTEILKKYYPKTYGLAIRCVRD